jgi:hypothetical protein
MRGFFKDITSDNITQKGFFICFLIILLSCGYAVFYFNNLPPLLPLFNQLPWGEQRLIETAGIFIPPIISFLILLINLILASLIYKKVPLISRVLAITCLLISVLTFLFVIRTVQAVL